MSGKKPRKARRRRKRQGHLGYARSLFLFFISFGLIGALLLELPVSHTVAIKPLDAFFVSMSALCVTGLSPISLTTLTLFGQYVMIALIKLGALGILSMSSLLLLTGLSRLSFGAYRNVEAYANDDEHFPGLVRFIFYSSFLGDLIFAILLYPYFFIHKVPHPIFHSYFYSVSAFANAGFSLTSNSLESMQSQPYPLIVMSSAIILGGIGFFVIYDLLTWAFPLSLRAQKKSKKESYQVPQKEAPQKEAPHHRMRTKLHIHTKISLVITFFLLLIGTIFFALAEWNTAFKGMGIGGKILSSFFESVTTRTAGFASIDQSQLRPMASLFATALMFIGGNSGSTAGGIKITTFFILVVILVGRTRKSGNIRIFRREIHASTVMQGSFFVLRALFLILASFILLAFTERDSGISLLRLFFEVMSAFNTVGLSMDLTPLLTHGGKIVIIATMLAGRVGLFALISGLWREKDEDWHYVPENVLIG